MIPDGREIAFECENGHINDSHKSQPASSDKGFMPVCVDCGARLERTLVPLRECKDCGNVWAYTGDADRPTCSNCRGKNTVSLADS